MPDTVFCGSGFSSVTQRGSEHGDELTPDGFVTNHAGGILGGISTGQDIVVTIGIKPTSSIRVARRSIDKQDNPVTVETNGRHDPCVGIRATPIAEAMLALVLMDHALLYRAENADVATKTPKIAWQIEMGSGMSIDLSSERLMHADFGLCIPLCHIGAARWLIMEGKSRKEST